MVDLEVQIDPNRLNAIRRSSAGQLGVFFDPSIVSRISQCIVDKVQAGLVNEGILYRDLVKDSGVPSWFAHSGLLGPVLALVSVQSYEESGILLSALTQPQIEQQLPSLGFCRFLEELGLVRSFDDRDACIEIWDLQWKHVISHLESSGACSDLENTI